MRSFLTCALVGSLSLSTLAQTPTQEQKLRVDSLWDSVTEFENESKLNSARQLWKDLNFKSLPLPEQLRLFLLGLKLDGIPSRMDAMKVVLMKRLRGDIDGRSFIILFNHREVFSHEGFAEILDEIGASHVALKQEYDSVVGSGEEELSPEELKEIFNSNTRDRGMSFIFIACRSNREYPCRLVLKNKKGQLVKTAKTIWSLPVLAKSKFDLPFNFENGHTPTGFFLVDSVMPDVERIKEYGKNRRLILRVVNKATVAKILPLSQKERFWWKQPFLSRELGREDLRLHGTGQINTELHSPHPTLVASHGCLKLREGTYDGVKFNDQRLMLDALMQAQGLNQSSQNESHIRANLLVVNLPGEGAVNLEDIQDYLKE